MKKIIVPIDFSSASDQAIEFAKNLCSVFNAKLEVIYCWRPHVEAQIDTGFVMIENEKIRRKNLQNFLEQHGLEKRQGKLMIGFAADVITDLSSKKSTLMVVMGTVQKYGLAEKLLGSVTSFTIKNARCPVLLVPPKVEFKGDFKKILMASEVESTDAKSLRKIIKYIQPFNAEVEFANVSAFGEEGHGLHISGEALEKITRKSEIGFSFSVVDIYSQSIEGGLNQHCKDNDIDLVVLVTQKHPWWERLFKGKSTIEPEKIALDMHRPLLVWRM